MRLRSFCPKRLGRFISAVLMGVMFFSPLTVHAAGLIPAPRDVTDNEFVVGYFDPTGTGSYDHAYYWQGPNGMGFYHITTGSVTDMGLLTGATGNDSGANGVSNDGMAIAGYSHNSSGQFEATRWTPGGGMVGLGDLAGGTFNSFASAMSSDGNTLTGTGNSGVGSEAFIWTSAGGMVGLGDLSGGFFFSRANTISSDGLVIIGDSNSTNGWEAFRWTSAGGTWSGWGIWPEAVLAAAPARYPPTAR
jgi:probable HAF family extracellular repeat protein